MDDNGVISYKGYKDEFEILQFCECLLHYSIYTNRKWQKRY